MTEANDNVIAFKTRDQLGESSAPIQRIRKHECGHTRGVLVDDKARTVECKACEVKLDPIQALIIMAHDYDWTWLYQQKKQLQKDVNELEDQRSKLKADVAALKRKLKP